MLPFTLAPLVALLIVVLALDEAGAALTSRSVAGILVWWGLLMAAAFSLIPRAHVPRIAVVCAGLLTGLALLALLSTGWAASAESAFAEADRLLLYTGVMIIPVVVARRGQAGWWADGMAAGIGVVAALALGQRLFPGTFPEYELSQALPAAANRLSWPLGYWNGLGIFVALGAPLLLRVAVTARLWPWRAAAVAAMPAIAGTLYLTSSRGGVAVAIVSVVAFVLLCGQGVRAVLALLAGGAGSGVAIAILHAHPVLVDGPIGTSAASDAGSSAAPLIVLVAVACGLGYAALTAVVRSRLALPRGARFAVAAAALVAVFVGLAAVDVSTRLDEFKAAPPDDGAGTTAIGSHLASGGGSGRWQFWSAAVDQFQAHPAVGDGAGSYEAWWAQHGSLDWFVRNAHSLWLETLGELGVIGFVLLVGAFGIALVSGVRRLRSQLPDDRATVGALLALLVGFVVGASLDWVWQLPVVALVAMLAVGLLVGPATQPRLPEGDRPVAAERARDSRSITGSFGLRVCFCLAAWAVICSQAIPYLSSQEVQASRRAVGTGNVATALERAESAVSIQPWASSPRLQLALVQERAGQVEAARDELARAISRDSANWRLQVVAARLAAKDGDIPAARRALARARQLNPRSPFLRRAAG